MKIPALLAARPRAAGGVALSAAEIRELRGGRPRKAFARQLGVSVATVYLWEAGRVQPSLASRARLRRLVARAAALARRVRPRRRSG